MTRRAFPPSTNVHVRAQGALWRNAFARHALGGGRSKSSSSAVGEASGIDAESRSPEGPVGDECRERTRRAFAARRTISVSETSGMYTFR